MEVFISIIFYLLLIVNVYISDKLFKRYFAWRKDIQARMEELEKSREKLEENRRAWEEYVQARVEQLNLRVDNIADSLGFELLDDGKFVEKTEVKK